MSTQTKMGRVTWHDLMTSDIGETKRFCAELLGWACQIEHAFLRPSVAITGGTILIGAALSVRRLVEDRTFDHIEQDLSTPPAAELEGFSPDLVADLPEPARRYLLHAIAPGTPLAPAVHLQMEGTMTPTPGSARVHLTAKETLAPRCGFVWTAHARMYGLPVRVRDHYVENDGGVHVNVLSLVPLPLAAEDEDVTRSSRGRLIGEAVWCPTALVAPGVTWEAVDADRTRFTLAVDGAAAPVTIHVGPEGALREVTLNRWGDVGVASPRLLPYGFRIEEEATFEGITIPTRLRGGWWYGTERFDPDEAAVFTVRSATFARTARGGAPQPSGV